MLTEEELRGGLRALTAAAPPAAPARVGSSVRRARFMRARRVVVGSAAAVAVIVPGTAFLASLGGTDLSTPANWAYRPNPAWRTAADRAFAEWKEGHVLSPGERPHWLYADEVPGTGDVAVAFATCRKKDCSKLVLMTAQKGEAGKADGDPDATSWDNETKDLLPETRLPVLSALLDAEDSAGARSQENVLFVLPVPNATRVTYHSPTLRSGTGGAGALVRQPDGSFVGRPGYLSAAVTLRVYDASNRFVQYGELTGAGNTLWVEDVDLPPGYDHKSGGRGQLRDQGGFAWEQFDLPPFTLFLRCGGTAPLTVTAGGQTKSVPCTGRVEVVGENLRSDGAPVFRIEGDDPYTAFAWAVAVRS